MEDPSSSAGSNRPTIEATVMTPAARPQSAGSQADARPPTEKTGIGSKAVASAAADAAKEISTI